MKTFSLKEVHYDEPEIGTWDAWEIIASDTSGKESITCNSVDELVALRDILIGYAPIAERSSAQDSGSVAFHIIKGYLEDVSGPATSDEQTDTHVISSQEILLDLADMADVSINDVAQTMKSLGYITARRDGKVGWLVKSK